MSYGNVTHIFIKRVWISNFENNDYRPRIISKDNIDILLK